MLDLETVEREIDKLEHREASYKLCERLSWLYVVRDHLLEEKYPQAAGTTPKMEGSEFLEAASNVPYPDLMRLIDEHLEAIKMVYPKTFSALIDKIRQL